MGTEPASVVCGGPHFTHNALTSGTIWRYRNSIIITNLRRLLLIKQAVREAATICTSPVTLTFDLESGVRVTCDVGYLCANFSLPRPLCSQLRPDVRDRRQTDRRQTASSLIGLLCPAP